MTVERFCGVFTKIFETSMRLTCFRRELSALCNVLLMFSHDLVDFELFRYFYKKIRIIIVCAMLSSSCQVVNKSLRGNS